MHVSFEEAKREADSRMKTVAIIQARMGSTRLPGKVLLDLAGETVLQRVVQRSRRSKLVHDIIIATTTQVEDDVLENECKRLGVQCFHGSKDDVLDRYYHAARSSAADIIVRITADCPFVDPELIDETIALLRREEADYSATDVPATIPRGTDVEAFTFPVLERGWLESSQPHEREHVTPYFYQHPELFRLATLKSELDCQKYRWTLDTPDDLTLLREIAREFKGNCTFTWREIVALMKHRPDLMTWNAQVVQKSVKS